MVQFGVGERKLSIKPNAKPVHLSPNHGTALRVAAPAQLKFFGNGYRILHIERSASSGNIAHGAVDDRAALAKDNFPAFNIRRRSLILLFVIGSSCPIVPIAFRLFLHMRRFP